MDKKESFKAFLKSNKDLAKLVTEGKTTYQHLFETYDIYGDDTTVWNNIRKEKSSNSTFQIKDVLNNIKNIDIDKLEDNISSLEKALGFLEEIMASRNEKKEERHKKKASSSEIERFFDD